MKESVPLSFAFILVLIALIFFPIFFPNIRLIAFAPFFSLVFIRKPFKSSLWIIGACSLLMDLTSSQMRFGLWTLNGTLTLLTTYRFKHYFYEDKASAVCLYSTLIACISSLWQLVLMYQFSSSLFSIQTVIFDCIFMSVLDAFYAFFWFTCPMRIYAYVKKVGLRRLFNVRRS